MSKQIPVSGTKAAIVDDVDFELVSKYVWHLDTHKGTKYARTNIRRKKVRMHRLIMGCRSDELVDHVDGDGLNNTRSNLRLCNKIDNGRNSFKRRSDRSSTYKGVSRIKKTGKWRSYIKLGDKQKHLGHFNTEKEAAKAYNQAASLHYGKFAKLNRV